MSEWQPIETAPKDGTDILVYSANEGQAVAWWDAEFGFDYVGPKLTYKLIGAWTAGTATGVGTLDGEYLALEPTHWMRLPAPPEVQP